MNVANRKLTSYTEKVRDRPNAPDSNGIRFEIRGRSIPPACSPAGFADASLELLGASRV
jgi:hypothetical protein